MTISPLDRAEVTAAMLKMAEGVLVVFEASIRNHDDGRGVRGIEYRTHPDAEKFLRSVCAEVSAETELSMSAAHRYGEHAIGDIALIAVVAAPHRAEAFVAC